MDGNILKEKLQKSDFQLIDIAEKLNISPQSLQSRFKSKEISIKFLIDVCIAIRKSPYYFIEGTEFEKYFKIEGLNIFEEPTANYNLTIPQKLGNENSLIVILQQQIDDLKKDKEFLKGVINQKMGKERQTGS